MSLNDARNNLTTKNMILKWRNTIIIFWSFCRFFRGFYRFTTLLAKKNSFLPWQKPNPASSWCNSLWRFKTRLIKSNSQQTAHRRLGDGFFMWKNLMWHWPVGLQSGAASAIHLLPRSTAQHRVSILVNGPETQTIAPRTGQPGPYNTWLLGPTWVGLQVAFRPLHVAVWRGSLLWPTDTLQRQLDHATLRHLQQ